MAKGGQRLSLRAGREAAAVSAAAAAATATTSIPTDPATTSSYRWLQNDKNNNDKKNNDKNDNGKNNNDKITENNGNPDPDETDAPTANPTVTATIMTTPAPTRTPTSAPTRAPTVWPSGAPVMEADTNTPTLPPPTDDREVPNENPAHAPTTLFQGEVHLVISLAGSLKVDDDFDNDESLGVQRTILTNVFQAMLCENYNNNNVPLQLWHENTLDGAGTDTGTGTMGGHDVCVMDSQRQRQRQLTTDTPIDIGADDHLLEHRQLFPEEGEGMVLWSQPSATAQAQSIVLLDSTNTNSSTSTLKYWMWNFTYPVLRYAVDDSNADATTTKARPQDVLQAVVDAEIESGQLDQTLRQDYDWSGWVQSSIVGQEQITLTLFPETTMTTSVPSIPQTAAMVLRCMGGAIAIINALVIILLTSLARRQRQHHRQAFFKCADANADAAQTALEPQVDAHAHPASSSSSRTMMSWNGGRSSLNSRAGVDAMLYQSRPQQHVLLPTLLSDESDATANILLHPIMS